MRHFFFLSFSSDGNRHGTYVVLLYPSVEYRFFFIYLYSSAFLMLCPLYGDSFSFYTVFSRNCPIVLECCGMFLNPNINLCSCRRARSRNCYLLQRVIRKSSVCYSECSAPTNCVEMDEYKERFNSILDLKSRIFFYPFSK